MCRFELFFISQIFCVLTILRFFLMKYQRTIVVIANFSIFFSCAQPFFSFSLLLTFSTLNLSNIKSNLNFFPPLQPFFANGFSFASNSLLTFFYVNLFLIVSYRFNSHVFCCFALKSLRALSLLPLRTISNNFTFLRNDHCTLTLSNSRTAFCCF